MSTADDISPVYRFVDLFAGIGGFRRGFERTLYPGGGEGFVCVGSAENDKYAASTYAHLYGDDPTADVSSETFKKTMENTPYDVLCGGFPCQTFSRAGLQEGFRNTTKGTLFFDVADIVQRTEPKAFLLENVDNLLSHDKGKTFATILHTLVAELGYTIIGVNLLDDDPVRIGYAKSDLVVNSRNFRVPQNRPRVYLMGFSASTVERVGGEEYLPVATPKKSLLPALYPSVREVLDPHPADELFLSSGAWQSMQAHRARHSGKGNGFGYIIVNRDNGEYPVSNALLATGGSGKERNLIYDPSRPELAGTWTKGKKTPVNSDGVRYMSPMEWGRLQGFVDYAFKDAATGADRFSFPANMSATQQYKMFGNAVTVPVVEEMAAMMLDVLGAAYSTNPGR